MKAARTIRFRLDGRTTLSEGPRGYVRAEFKHPGGATFAHRRDVASFFARHVGRPLCVLEHNDDQTTVELRHE